MQTRTSKWFHVALIVLLNVGGGPLSWAHGAMGGAPAPASAAVEQQAGGAQHCPDHAARTQGSTEPAPVDRDESPCCADGACHCGCPPSLALITSMRTVLLERTARPAETPPLQILFVPQGNPLRPPIA